MAKVPKLLAASITSSYIAYRGALMHLSKGFEDKSYRSLGLPVAWRPRGGPNLLYQRPGRGVRMVQEPLDGRSRTISPPKTPSTTPSTSASTPKAMPFPFGGACALSYKFQYIANIS